MSKYYSIYMEKIDERNYNVITHEFLGMWFNPIKVNITYNNFVENILENLSYYELEEYEKFNIYVTEETYEGYYECLYGVFINSDGSIETYNKNDGDENE